MVDYLNRLGKQGKINMDANKKVWAIWKEKEIKYCENCGYTWGLSTAHRHKRVWYRSCPEKLYDFQQILRLCYKCHNNIEFDRDKTEEMFMRLRGEE